MSQKVMEKAQDLGKAIAETEEYKEVKEKQALMFRNRESQELLRNYQAMKEDIQKKQAMGEPVSPEEQKAMEQMELKMSENPIIKDFMEAQNRFQQLLNKAIQTVVEASK
ncbi:MAG: YlbF family regulator [Peptococcaceae bacterium]|nr:YlbF family regulator [Peptococcaceae bacterium]